MVILKCYGRELCPDVYSNLHSFKKDMPVQIYVLSRGCDTDDIIAVIAITALQAK